MAKKPKAGRGHYQRKEGVHKVGDQVSRIAVVIDLGTREAVDTQVAAAGTTLSKWLREAVQEKLDRDG